MRQTTLAASDYKRMVLASTETKVSCYRRFCRHGDEKANGSFSRYSTIPEITLQWSGKSVID